MQNDIYINIINRADHFSFRTSWKAQSHWEETDVPFKTKVLIWHSWPRSPFQGFRLFHFYLFTFSCPATVKHFSGLHGYLVLPTNFHHHKKKKTLRCNLSYQPLYRDCLFHSCVDWVSFLVLLAPFWFGSSNPYRTWWLVMWSVIFQQGSSLELGLKFGKIAFWSNYETNYANF